MIALVLLLAQATPEPGAFVHGPWQGRCYRDGYMAGMDHELCRATMKGPMTIDFERDAATMVFRATAEGCEPITINIDRPPESLAPKKRAESMAGMLQFMIQASLKGCKAKAPKLDATSLGAMLTETSGLASRN